MTEHVACPWLELDGRLGNSLFQIAGTIGVAERLGATPAFPEWTYAGVFQLPPEWFHPRDQVPGRPVDTLVPHLPGRAARYLQDPSLFADSDTVRDVLRLAPWARDVILREWFDLTRMLPEPYVGVHVRRGDNLTNEPGTINCLPQSYYRQGLFAIYQRVGGPKPYPSVLVFSDDPDWCHENMPGMVYRGKPRPKEGDADYWTDAAVDWIDLMLFAECTYHVMSNSTYAWWGAWLSGDPAPVFPSYWYGAQVRAMGLDPGLLFPSGWESIEVDDPNPQPVAPGVTVRLARLVPDGVVGTVRSVGWEDGHGYAEVDWPTDKVRSRQPLANLTICEETSWR